MKLMILGDVHGNTKWLCHAVDVAKKHNCKKIIQLGDFGIWDHKPSGVSFLDVANECLSQQNIKLHFVDGNHENHDHLQWYDKHLPKTYYGHTIMRSHIFHIPRGCVWSWSNVDGNPKTFAGVGGAWSIDKSGRVVGESWWPGEQLTENEATEIISNARPVNYLFTHDGPTTFPINLKPYLESQAHQQRITSVGNELNPDRWFHGHYHYRVDYEHYNSLHEKWISVHSMNMDGYNDSIGILDTASNSFIDV